jgi:hypothetical protein
LPLSPPVLAHFLSVPSTDPSNVLQFSRMNSTPRCVCYYFLLSSTKTVLNFPLPALLQSLIHTRHTSGFIIPGAHHVQHNSRPPANITIVAADGNAIEAETFKAVQDLRAVGDVSLCAAGLGGALRCLYPLPLLLWKSLTLLPPPRIASPSYDERRRFAKEGGATQSAKKAARATS